MTPAPFAMIVVALLALFVFVGFFALVAVLVARSGPSAVETADHRLPAGRDDAEVQGDSQ